MLVRVLGPLEVVGDDGASIPITRPVERRILTALAALHPRAVPTDTLIDAVWAEAPPPSARKTLQTNIFRLRRRLGPDALVSDRSGYRLAADVTIDADELETAMAAPAGTTDPDARPLGERNDHADGRDGGAEDAALASFHGTPFDELDAWPPVMARRGRLEELQRMMQEARMEAALRERRGHEVIPELEELVAAEPLREPRWCLLVRALAGAGREAEALRSIERARLVLRDELGTSPGPGLRDLEASLLAATTPHLRIVDRATEIDRLQARADAALARGELRPAVDAYVRAAHLARAHGDHRRFALAVLGAAGSGWQTGLDATAEIVSLLAEAVDFVPAGPTPLRARLLARLAVARSHHGTGEECEAAARAALAIARLVDDPESLAHATYALALVIDDPSRRVEQRRWLAQLDELSRRHPSAPWRRWALPLVARAAVADGDIGAAIGALGDLAVESERAHDVVGRHAAAHAGVLVASVAGDWPAARAHAQAVRDAGEVALVDPVAARLAHRGMLGIIDLCAGAPIHPGPDVAEWPRPSMAWSVLAWSADGEALAGDLDGAGRRLASRDPGELLSLPRDGYWLSTLAMLADAAHRTGCRPVAAAVADLCEPLLGLTIADPGLLYRGAVVHAAGLAHATCGRRREAEALLREAVEVHRANGSSWMVDRSEEALATLRPSSARRPGPAGVPSRAET